MAWTVVHAWVCFCVFWLLCVCNTVWLMNGASSWCLRLWVVLQHVFTVQLLLYTQCTGQFSCLLFTYIHTYVHPFKGPLSRTTRVRRYQKGKTNLDFTEARDSEWKWRQLSHMQVCTSLQTDNHASTPPLSFLQAGCPSCYPTNSVKALKALLFTFS